MKQTSWVYFPIKNLIAQLVYYILAQLICTYFIYPTDDGTRDSGDSVWCTQQHTARHLVTRSSLWNLFSECQKFTRSRLRTTRVSISMLGVVILQRQFAWHYSYGWLERVGSCHK